MLRQVQVSEEPYLSEIADKLDTSYHALKKYADAARELNLIEDGERKGKKQMLQNNWDGYIEVYTGLWDEIQEEFKATDSFNISEERQKPQLVTDYEKLTEDDTKTNLLKRYFEHHLVNNTDQNLEDIMVDDLAIAYLLLSQRDGGILRQEDIGHLKLLQDEEFVDFMTYELYKYIITRKSGSFSMISAIIQEEQK
jgi:hypothetical protein